MGDTQTPSLRYLPIQSKYDKMGYCIFNSPYYIKVKKHMVNNIAIRIDIDTEEHFPIFDRKVICRFHFRRGPLLAWLYIRNHVTKSIHFGILHVWIRELNSTRQPFLTRPWLEYFRVLMHLQVPVWFGLRWSALQNVAGFHSGSYLCRYDFAKGL